MLWLAVVFALASAATTAVSTSTQHLATGRAPTGDGVFALMRFLVRRPEWLLAILLGPVGFTFHVLALQQGPIALVQPLAISGLVFAVPVRAALARTRPPLAEVGAVAVTALALAVFLLTSDVQYVDRAPDMFVLFVGSAACAGSAVLAVAASRGVAQPTARAFLLGCASGVLFGLMAVLIEACELYQQAHGTVALATSWLPYALVAAGVSGVSVNQLAYRSARLSASMPVLNVVNCLLALAFAYLVFHETPRHDVLAILVSLGSLAAMAWGLWMLARVEGEQEELAEVRDEERLAA